jgi:glycosyltransferase involved in cell wall biosynthesis
MGIAPEVPVVLLYTRFFEFSQEKLHYLLAEIHNQRPEVKFLVVGKGRQGEEELLLAAGKKHSFAEALVLAGWVEPQLLPAHLAAADLAIYPFADTLVNRTKCPAKLTEILLAGRAVVADRVGQIAEYVADGSSGILCDPDNWQEMVRQVLRLVDDPQWRAELGAAGSRYLREQFSWSDYAVKLEGLYTACLTGIARQQG